MCTHIACKYVEHPIQGKASCYSSSLARIAYSHKSPLVRIHVNGEEEDDDDQVMMKTG